MPRREDIKQDTKEYVEDNNSDDDTDIPAFLRKRVF